MGISDHFVGTREQWRYGNADRLGSLRINDQLKLGWVSLWPAFAASKLTLSSRFTLPLERIEREPDYPWLRYS
jgi:hypothetical protein